MDRCPATGNWRRVLRAQTVKIWGEAQWAESTGRGQNCEFPMLVEISGGFMLPTLTSGAKNSPYGNGTDHKPNF